MDFINSSLWLMGMKKLIFYVMNFFGCGHFSIFFSDLMDGKMAGANKIVYIKNQSFQGRHPHKGIFQIRSYWCCIFTIFGQSFKWSPVTQEIFLVEN